MGLWECVTLYQLISIDFWYTCEGDQVDVIYRRLRLYPRTARKILELGKYIGFIPLFDVASCDRFP